MKILNRILEKQRLNILFERCYCIQQLNGNINGNQCIEEIAGIDYCKKCKHGGRLEKKKNGGKNL